MFELAHPQKVLQFNQFFPVAGGARLFALAQTDAFPARPARG